MVILCQHLYDLNHELSISPSDGHCLIHSFVTSWNSRFPHHKTCTAADVLLAAVSEWEACTDIYEPHIDDTETPISIQWDRYINQKIYDQPVCDIFPHILANAFKLDLCILDEKSDGICDIIHVTSKYEPVSATPLYLHRVGDSHYNGVTEVKSIQPRLTYSRDDLLKFNQPGNITRNVRKCLFRNNIWDSSHKNHVHTTADSGVNVRRKSPVSCLKGEILNPWSACNKPLLIREHILDENRDFLGLVETYQINDAVKQALLPPDYDLAYNPRSLGKKSKGGGVALIYRKSIIKCSIVKKYNFASFEGLHTKLTLPHTILNVVVIYAPSPKTSQSASDNFIAEFSPVLFDDLCDLTNLLVLGDFNYHFQDKNCKFAKEFAGILKSCNLVQHIRTATHIKGNTLDLVITRADELLPSRIKTSHDVSPDHFGVLFEINVEKPETKPTPTSWRDWKSFDADSFSAGLLSSEISSVLESSSVHDAVDKYDLILGQLLDKHVPLKTRSHGNIRQHNASWYNDSIRESKRTRRQYERRWRKSKLESHREDYRSQCNIVNAELENARSSYYHDQLEGAKSQKEVYKVANDLIFGAKSNTLPTANSIPELVERFSEYFSTKIQTLRSDLDKHVNHNATSNFTPGVKHLLTEFTPVSEDYIKKHIKKCASKSCDLDPIPTWLLKLCLNELSPYITHIVNLSLTTSEVSPNLKLALIAPLIKKALLDPEILKNFRPVSNLSFISKLIERVVAEQLNDHLRLNGLLEKFQSAYKKFHSTETALLRVQNDLLIALDSDGGVVLMLLDLSAAFDTIDHSILLRRLYTLGIRGPALQWFKSYLSNRKQAVYLNKTKSSLRDLPYGVPQGSVLGPILFTLYTLPLGQIATKYGLKYHIYADDTQLYISFKPQDPTSLAGEIENIQSCFLEIKQWMTDNLLKLNGDKTELLISINKHKRQASPLQTVNLDGEVIELSSTIRNLGAHFNIPLDHSDFINVKCKAAHYSLRNISRVRSTLTRKACETLINAYVTSKMDYCNCLLYGVPSYAMERLQKVQNYAARVITKTPKYDHITPVLADLHWLPVKYRIEYKILLYVYKALHEEAPDYISELLVPYIPPRSLRSGDMPQGHRLIPPAVIPNYNCYGDRAFQNAAPILWNSLDQSVKDAPSSSAFKSRLKTYLFDLAYF